MSQAPGLPPIVPLRVLLQSTLAHGLLTEFPNSLDHSLQVYFKTCSIMASMTSPRSSPNSLDHGDGVHIEVHLITASKCLSKLPRSQPQSASLSSLDHILQEYLQTHSIMDSKFAWSWPFEVHRHTYLITTSMFAQSWPPMSIPKLAQSQSPSASPNLAQSQPWSASQSSLDHHHQAHLKLLSSTDFNKSRYTVCRWLAIYIHRWEYQLNTWVLKIVE